MTTPTRRSLGALLAGAALAPIVGTALAPASPALAQGGALDVRKGGSFQPIPIVVTRFLGEGVSGDKITGVMLADFKRSVFLTPVGGTPRRRATPTCRRRWSRRAR